MPPTVIVTGASGGIGRAATKRLAAEHNVVIVYHTNHATAEKVAREIEHDRDCIGETLLHQCDITDPESIASLVTETLHEFGGINGLINNAGVLQTKDITEQSIAELNEMISINLCGALYCTRAVLPHMLEQSRGHIVTVSSTAGITGSPTNPVYGASKAGLIGFAKSIAKIHTENGIFCNVVAPTATETAMFDPERRPPVEQSSPIGRLIKPEEVAEAILFFATTTCISGKVLEIDCGLAV